METFFWMLGEFASLKSKHDSGVAKAYQPNLLNVIANAVKQSFLHCHCEPKARQSLQLHNNRLPRRYAPRNDLGRSMIEMLGVLAIIGVLSVGGIAGYSKAMEKWKMDKTLEDLALLINEVIPYSQQFVANEPGGNLLPIIKSLNIVLASFDDKGTYLADVWNNKLIIQNCHVMPCWKFNYKLSNNSDLNAKFCYNIISFVQNFPQVVYRIDLNGGILLWGNSHCDKQTICLRDLNIQQIHDYCKNLCKEDCQLQVGFE